MLGWLILCVLVHVQSTNAPTSALANTSAPTTRAPTLQSDSFALPTLPISKANAIYPECRAELIFVLDVSGSVQKPNQLTMMRFVVKFMIAVEQNIQQAKFGVVLFGIDAKDFSRNPVKKRFNSTAVGTPGLIDFYPPFGNGKDVATETFLSLDSLQYNCTECEAVNSSWSQLEMMYTVIVEGALTPTWDGLQFATDDYELNGDPTVPGRFIVLITDGVPNDGPCGNYSFVTAAACAPGIARTFRAVEDAKNGTLLLSVGIGLNDLTRPLMVNWSSEPKSILAIPDTDYAGLDLLIDKILAVMCPAGAGIDCLAEDAKYVDIAGQGFLNTTELACRYFRDGEAPIPSRSPKGIFLNSTLIRCPTPHEDDWFPGEWNLNYTQDGRGFYKGARFKTGNLCRPELLIIWWPFCALALLPLAFCRSKKVAPVTTQKVSRGVARPAPAATEEYEEYEEVEEIVAPPEPVNKWKVAPTAYIGFGRARMSVDWAGVAPESAPHEGVRKKVVKKVVSDHAPVPTAGPASTPMPAAQEAPTETVTHSKPQTVEEPDWVNSFMDKIAAVVCCCCVGKK